jgi:ribosomal protein L37AE/L43A
MNNPRLEVVTLTARLEPIYKCSVCGREEAGETVTREGGSLEGLLNEHVPHAYMPVGWASMYQDRYRDRFECDVCLTSAAVRKHISPPTGRSNET